VPDPETRPIETFGRIVEPNADEVAAMEPGQNRRALVPGTGTGPN
jgi:hypothetical protein